jgi:hypothetical protein
LLRFRKEFGLAKAMNSGKKRKRKPGLQPWSCSKYHSFTTIAAASLWKQVARMYISYDHSSLCILEDTFRTIPGAAFVGGSVQIHS